MTLTINQVRDQLIAKMQVIADNHALGEVRHVFHGSEPFQNSGAYLQTQIDGEMKTGGPMAVDRRGSKLIFFVDFVVGHEDFDSTPENMPDHLGDLAEEFIDKLYADNRAAASPLDTSKARFEVPNFFISLSDNNRFDVSFWVESFATLAK